MSSIGGGDHGGIQRGGETNEAAVLALSSRYLVATLGPCTRSSPTAPCRGKLVDVERIHDPDGAADRRPDDVPVIRERARLQLNHGAED